MPDSRHVVLSRAAGEGEPLHLWMADTESARLQELTFGTSYEVEPSVSPDGKKILFTQSTENYDIASVSLADGKAGRLIATDRGEYMPAWAAHRARFAYVSDRNGPLEIRLHAENGEDRALVTEADFPKGTTRILMTPSLSPDGEKLVFVHVPVSGLSHLWIVSLAGGAPVRLTTSEMDEYGGSFSPDGNCFVFLSTIDGNEAIAVQRVGHQSPVEVLKRDLRDNAIPDWSPSGDWISYSDGKAWNLVSPNGKSTRALGRIETPHLAFSKDGKRLYGIQAVQFEPDRQMLFSIDVDTLKMRTIADVGRDNTPKTNVYPGMRFSVAPDGKSMIYSSAKEKRNLWMLEGLPGR
jgi:Tol biopolymer transport system component